MKLKKDMQSFEYLDHPLRLKVRGEHLRQKFGKHLAKLEPRGMTSSGGRRRPDPGGLLHCRSQGRQQYHARSLESVITQPCASILAEGAMTLPVTLSGGVLFAS